MDRVGICEAIQYVEQVNREWLFIPIIQELGPSNEISSRQVHSTKREVLISIMY